MRVEKDEETVTTKKLVSVTLKLSPEEAARLKLLVQRAGTDVGPGAGTINEFRGRVLEALEGL